VKVLIACEYSGVVRRAFAAKGHTVMSCDFLAAEDGASLHGLDLLFGLHYQGDVLELLRLDPDWDLMIAHPPCTHVAGSGARWLTDHWVKKKSHPQGRYWHDGRAKRASQAESIEFIRQLWAAPIKRKCIENPVGMLPKLWMPWTQKIQPFEYGHGETKATCLWLENLPPLVPTNLVEGREGRVWKMPPSKDRWKERSRTYQGIADAFADQWNFNEGG